MNATLEGSGALSPMDLSLPRSKGIVIGFWTVTALFCLQIGFTAYAQLSLPQVAEAFTHLGFPDYFRVELSLAKLLGVVLLLAPVPARLKEWAYAGFAITLGSALIAHFAVGDGPEAWGFAAATGVLWGLSYFFWRRLEATPLGWQYEKVGREPRPIGIGAHLERNRRARGLARENPQQNAQAHQGRTPRRRRGVEVGQSNQTRHPGLVARRHHLHWRILQECREANLRQGRVSEGSGPSLQLESRRKRTPRDRHPRRRRG